MKILTTDNIVQVLSMVHSNIDSKICEALENNKYTYFKIGIQYDDIDPNYPFIDAYDNKNVTPIYVGNSLKGFKIGVDEFTLSIIDNNVRLSGPISKYKVFINQTYAINGFTKITKGSDYIDIYFPNGWSAFVYRLYILLFK